MSRPCTLSAGCVPVGFVLGVCMTYGKLGLPLCVLAALIFAASVAVVPVAGASGTGNGVTRQISASGSTSYSPRPSGVDTGIRQREIGPGLSDAGSAAAPTGGNSNNNNG